MVLRSGDTLLLETSHAFVEQYQYRRDFMLVSPLQDSTPPDFRKAPVATLILVAMVAINAFGLLATRCVSVNRARMNVSVNLPILVVIGSAFAMGAAMEQSGTAAWIVNALPAQVIESPWLALIVVYLITSVFTEVITNNAAAVLVFPIAINIAEQLGVSPLPFVIAVMFAASASFMTPLGYQTNMMVMGPGGYRFTDYLKIGIPMALLAAVVTLLLIPIVWPFNA